MNITPRPIDASDKIDQSRDVAGISKWAQSSRTVSFIMFILGWFTIPVEVLLRRDFGQRWFTVVNFYAGLFLLLIFATVQYVTVAIWGSIENFIAKVASAINPLYNGPKDSYLDTATDNSMVFFLLCYLLMGSYHLFKIWWRNRTNTAVHSFADGTSRIEPLAGHVIKVINFFAIPFVFLYSRLIPKKQRKDMKTPRLINDRAAFTNTVFEPLFILFLAYQMPGIASLWLFLSAFALAICRYPCFRTVLK